MLIFDIIKKILINIITPPEAGNRRFRASNIRKLVKSPEEPLEEPLIESDDSLKQNITESLDDVRQSP